MTTHFSANWLARKLEIPRDELECIAKEADTHYHPFWKGNGVKGRLIDNPDERLKFIQRRINKAILPRAPEFEWVHGSVPGRSSLTNASAHVGRPSVTRVDIKRFFPNVRPVVVYQAFTRLGIGPDPAALLTRLTTYKGHLPQGAPTSSALANLVLIELDRDLDELAKQYNVRVTRYVDDIVLSGLSTRQVVEHVIGLVRRYGFAVRHKKTDVFGPNVAHIVTGYAVNGQRPSVSRRSRDHVRAAVHRFLKSRRIAADIGLERSINGRLAHLARTNPGAAERPRDAMDDRCIVAPERTSALQ